MAGQAHVLLVSQPRSGTTLLCSLLDSHPAVSFEREMLADHKYRGLPLRLLPLFKRFPAVYLQLRALRAVRRNRTPVYGCKVFPDHLGHHGPTLLKLAGDHGLHVIEDAAEAHGLQDRGEPCGSFGDISTFSFYANKLVTTGEGGMLLTDDASLFARKCDDFSAY
jgi:hypothetical protein